MPKESISVKIPKAQGQAILTIANKLQVLDKSLRIQKDQNEFLYIPLIHELSNKDLSLFQAKGPQLELATCLFAEKTQKNKTMKEILAQDIQPNLLSSLPKALDVIGDIAIIDIPPKLETYKNIIGTAIMKTHKNVRVVLAKAGAVSGTYRLRNLDFISGENRTNTIHKEYGCSYLVDVSKAYFSPRLSREHQRIANLVKKDETVIDLFAGVGPFAVLIAKRSRGAKVFAIDINEVAVDLLKQNTRLNRVEKRISVFAGDARQIVKENLLGTANRVIMNLPETASEFVDVACEALKTSGGVIHFYGFIRLPKTIADLKKLFSETVEKTGRKVKTFQYANTVRATAPYEYQVVLDAEII